MTLYQFKFCALLRNFLLSYQFKFCALMRHLLDQSPRLCRQITLTYATSHVDFSTFSRTWIHEKLRHEIISIASEKFDLKLANGREVLNFPREFEFTYTLHACTCASHFPYFIIKTSRVSASKSMQGVARGDA